ncbi:MAG: hypothetical protein V5A43_07035 [Haloarculaceae archaeon]
MAVAGCTESDGLNEDPDNSNGDTGDDTPGEDSTNGGDQATYSNADTLLSFAEAGDHDPPNFDEDHKEVSGQGRTYTDEISVERTLTAFVAEHHGAGSFKVGASWSEEGNAGLFDTVDEFKGTAATNGISDDLTLDIQAGGEWEVIIANPRSDPEETRRPPGSASGSGNQLVGPVAVEGSTTVTASHDGESSFVVMLLNETGDSFSDTSILYNEAGSINGAETELAEDYLGWVDVFAEGEWTLEFE